MAIRQRAGRKKPYLVYWKNPFTFKIESQSFESKAEAEKHDALIKYQLKYERDLFRRDAVEAEEFQTDTLEGVFYLYLKERNFAEENLDRTLKATQEIMKRYGDVKVGDINAKLLREMQKLCIDTGNKGSTVHRKMGIIKAVLNWAQRNGILSVMPTFPITAQGEPTRYMPPTSDEISKIYQVAPEHLKRVIILGFMFGMRVGPCEMLRLKWTDIDVSGKVIRIPNAKKGNNDPWREVPIRDSLLPIISQWQIEDSESGINHVVHYNGKPVHQIRHAWKLALERAGITRHIRPYDLRHGFATEAIAAGADYGTVAVLMGHKSPMMVLRHYQHVRNDQKKNVMENLPQPTLV